MTRGLRVLRLLAGFVVLVLLLAGLGAGGLIWRLTQGPLDVTGLVRSVIAARAPALSLDTAALSLAGPDLRFTLAGVQTAAEAGPRVAGLSITVEAAPLLHGAVRPREVIAQGVRLDVRREADGRFAVRGVPGAFALTEPPRAPGAPEQSQDSAYPTILGALTHVAVRDAAVSFTDVTTQQTGALQDLAIDLQRDAGGALAGHVQGVLIAGETKTGIALDASNAQSDSPIALHLAIGAVNPAALARLAPALAQLAALDAQVALTADVVLSPALGVQHVALHAQAGPGRAFLPKKGGGTAPGDFVSITLDADGDAHAVTLGALRVVVQPPSASPPTIVVLTGDATRGVQRAEAHLHLTLDRGQMADLSTIWPPGVGGNARGWLTENVTTGSVHDGAFDVTLQGGAALNDIAMTSFTGSMLAEDVTLYWLRPVPPITFPHVVLTMVDGDTLTLAAPAARQGALVGKQVFMRIVGMSVKDQFSQIDADVTAPIADVFVLLQHPRLKLLSVHPIPVTSPTGQSQTHLTVKLPLESKVTMESVDIHAVSHLTDARVPRLVAGKPLEAGVFDVDVTTAGMTLNGAARMAGIPSTLAVTMDFRSGAPNQVTEHVTMLSRADDKALASAGLDTIGLLSGVVSAKLDYAEQRDGKAVLQGTADLREAALSTPLGWSKPAGPAASVEAKVALDHGRLVGFDGIRAEGPGLSVRGRSELVDGMPSVLHVEHCVIGRTSLTGTLSFPLKPGDPLRVVLAGPQLDISGPLSSKTTFEPSTPDEVPAGRPYRVDLRFDRVLLSEKGEGLGPVTLTGSGDDRRIAQGHLISGGVEQVDVRIAPQGGGRRLTVSIGDLGLLLHRIGAGLELDQGAAIVDGVFDDSRAGSPLTATLSMTRFGVRGASVFGKILQAMTLYGLVDALRGPGLVFDQMILPFTLAKGVLELHGAHAFSLSLGVTAEGQVDLRRNTVNVTGTIVPAYFFNTLLGRVPLLGRLFSPEAGGGVFAATFGLRGPVADPAVTVNPLATLTPGALRGLFGLFD